MKHESDPRQFRFFADVDTSSVKPSLLMGREQIENKEKVIRGEMPSLWIVKKGEPILVPTKSGHSTRVFLEEDAILQRVLREENSGKKRPDYYLRTPVLVTSVSHHNKWTVEQGKRIDAFSKQKKISKKDYPRTISKLMFFTKI